MVAPENPDPSNLCDDVPPVEGPPKDSQGLQPLGLNEFNGQPVSWGFLINRLVLLAGVMSLAGFVAWLWNGKHHGAAGAELAIFSMVSCTVSAATAVLVVGVTAGGKSAFSGLMSSILFRTLGPLAAGTFWQLSRPDWPTDNLIQIHVPMFLVSLTVETILVVDIVSSSSRSRFTQGKGRISRNMHG
jgi:hypothetical protein